MAVAEAAADTCTACGACAPLCPTGALSVDEHEDPDWHLTYDPAYCTACGVCIRYCDAGSLSLRSATLAEVLGGRRNLFSARLSQCDSCGEPVLHRPPDAGTARRLCRSCAQSAWRNG